MKISINRMLAKSKTSQPLSMKKIFSSVYGTSRKEIQLSFRPRFMHSTTTAKKIVEEFMSLLTGLFSNIEKAQTMQDHLAKDHFLDFFTFKLAGTLNFCKHQVFVDSAAECEAESKIKLIACGKEIQQLVHTGREKAADAARSKLRACSDDFKTFGGNFIAQHKVGRQMPTGR